MAWEYLMLKVPSGRAPLSDSEFMTKLAEVGYQNWELVCVESGLAYLKRPFDPDDLDEPIEAAMPVPHLFEVPPGPSPAPESEEDYDENPFDPGDVDAFLDEDPSNEFASHGERRSGGGQIIKLPPPPSGHDPELTGVI